MNRIAIHPSFVRRISFDYQSFDIFDLAFPLFRCPRNSESIGSSPGGSYSIPWCFHPPKRLTLRSTVRKIHRSILQRHQSAESLDKEGENQEHSSRAIRGLPAIASESSKSAIPDCSVRRPAGTLTITANHKGMHNQPKSQELPRRE